MKPKRVALYCRVSSDDQKERDTIENQVDMLNTYVEMKDDLKAFKPYLDDGISGTVAFGDRPYGKQLIEDAKNSFFDTVLVWKVDRFGRDTLSGLQAVEMLRKYDIEVVSVTEPFDLNTPTGRYQFINYLNMAELERNNILDRMFIGATRAAKKGKWLGGIVPYGYSKNIDGYLEINEDEAKIIRKIYDLYTEEKMASLAVAHYLNDTGVPTSCGSGKGKRKKGITGKWRSTSIQRILTSTTYKGIHEYGKRSSRRKETIFREVPAIIDENQWAKAQVQKKINSIRCDRNCKRRNFLLRRLIKCAHCGKTYYGISYSHRYDVYHCSGKRGDNKKVFEIECDNVNLNANMVEQQVWSDVEEILRNYAYYINDIREKSSSNNNSYVEDDINKLLKSLELQKREKNNILTLYRKNLITEEELNLQINDMRKEEENTQKLIAAFKAKMDLSERADELINSMADKLKYYNEKIDNLNDEDKRDAIELLVKEIKVDYVIENGAKIPVVTAVYNLMHGVKLDTHTDMDSRQPQA